MPKRTVKVGDKIEYTFNDGGKYIGLVMFLYPDNTNDKYQQFYSECLNSRGSGGVLYDIPGDFKVLSSGFYDDFLERIEDRMK